MPVKKGLSPVQRTLRELRNQGCISEKVEYFNPYAGEHGKRQDLFGIIDIVALAPDGIIGIQACAGSGFAEHKRKILESEYTHEWLKSGGKLELWAWRKVLKQRGGKQKIWAPRIERIK